MGVFDSRLRHRVSAPPHYLNGIFAIMFPGKSEIFCKVSMGSQGQRTPVAPGPNPQWQASMQFLVKDLQEDSLCITVFERGQFKPDGKVLVDIDL